MKQNSVRILTNISVCVFYQALMLHLLFNNSTIGGLLVSLCLGVAVYCKYRSIYCDLRLLENKDLYRENICREFDSNIFESIGRVFVTHRFEF